MANGGIPVVNRVLLTLIVLLASFGSAAAQLTVVSTTPAVNQTVAVNSTVSVEFDRALNTATVNADTFRVFGRGSGTATGTYAFSNGNKTVTLTPDQPFTAGEFVFVNLSEDITAADTTTLRTEGYALQFTTATAPAGATFQQIDVFSNRTGGPGGPQTRIYGAASTDLDNDEYLDLATVNEVSGDVRVFLNLADGSGLYDSMLAPEPIGLESSPNEPADFDNDGLTDLCTAAATDGVINVLLGSGDGNFSGNQEITVGSQPHGIAPLDVDGDGDLDIVNANVGSNNLSLMINDGNGGFGSPTFFEGGVNGEYGLTQADMDEDGITDLVVAGRNGSEIATMLGNGNGTFTAAGPAQSTGGQTWVVVVGDVNGDGDLDAVTANDGDGTVGVLIGEGDGTFEAVDTISVGSHLPSVDLGDLDGDGDLDLVASSFGGGFWRRFENDGTGSFSFVEDIPAPNNPSCSILLDFDNDGDLDMALTDEIADVVILMENGSGGTGCSPAPSACRTPVAAGKSKLKIIDKTDSEKDKLTWSFTKGETTTLVEFGDPVSTPADAYDLCLYENGQLVQSFAIPAAGGCDILPCWKPTGSGLSYRDRELTPDGILTTKLTPGNDDKTKIKVVGKGTRLGIPDLDDFDTDVVIQLQKQSDALCWGATFSPPFTKNDGTTFRDSSDAPDPSTPLPLWSDIHSQVIGTSCGGCHGGSGGLSGLGDCNTAHASLISIVSTENPTMNRVEPGNSFDSWLMHKLDGTHSWFTADCVGGFCGSQMPLGTPLPLATRDAIRAWITNGAVNDCP
jgi:hypothetical protein